jgi:N-acetylneuraminic acid mutarotase
VSYQRVIEEVYWRHRIWPKERPDPKPSLDAVMSQAQLENKVEEYVRKSQALEDYWKRPITADQLQAEMDRMAKHTKQPEVLHELFEALGNDPFVIAECLARPALSERLLTNCYAQDQRFYGELKLSAGSWRAGAENQTPNVIAAVNANYMLPTISDGGCTDDTWAATSTTNAPDGRSNHSAVWTGSEMIVWGGGDGISNLNTGGRYNPSIDTWTATSTINAPTARAEYTAVWTGSEMILWGGRVNNGIYLNTGGRYNPSTDSWAATSITNAPTARTDHTAVWTGSEMIVWGGFYQGISFNTGGRYNPNTNSWTTTSTSNAPDARYYHTAVWTGSEMILWGGIHDPNNIYLNSGGRYNPSTDSWVATSTTNAPARRLNHTAFWTGSEMIVWGGFNGASDLDTGGRYNPATDSWAATSTTNAPDARDSYSAVWTGSEMIVWGGLAYDDNGPHWLNTGGRYCAQSGPPPTPTPTPTATPTPSATPRPSPTPRHMPSPKPRPTPAPRP